MRFLRLLPLFLALPSAGRADLKVPVPGRVVDLSAPRPAVVSPRAGAAPVHLLAKLAAGGIDEAGVEALRRAGLAVVTVLSRDSVVLYGPAGNASAVPEIAWFSPLLPQDKAAEPLISGSAPLPPLSVLGHPGSTAADLASAARASGLEPSGGYDSRFGARIEIRRGAAAGALLRFLENDAVFAAAAARPPRLANDRSVGTIQSGVPLGPTPVFDHGLYGGGETIGILDTGLDVDSCFFSDAANPFPVNVYSPDVGYGAVSGGSHRKIAAYDFLHPCGAFAAPCDSPEGVDGFDNEGHGTHVAGNAAGDDLAHPLLHDAGDGMAPGARLVIQDGGYAGPSDPCGDLPGLGCAPSGIEPILEQAYAQGARIHSDSWSDDSAGPPPADAGYSMTARDVDDFAFRHPDFLPFFVAGNAGERGPSSIPSPGNGKNVVCVGSTRNAPAGSDEDLSDFSGIGPAADGRIKPDVVAPGVNVSASSDFTIASDNCGTAAGAGTSFATPTAAGAAALVREYFVRGFYPRGEPDPAGSFSPSAALVKAMLIASGRPLSGTRLGVPVASAPSNEQGFGRIDLSRVLAFPESPFRLLVADRVSAFAAGQIAPVLIPLSVRPGAAPLRATLVWTDPPGIPRAFDDSTPELVDDLDLSIVAPGGSSLAGNGRTDGDRVNNVEQVTIPGSLPGTYLVRIDPRFVAPGPPVGFAVVVTGDFTFDAGGSLAIDPGSARLVEGAPVVFDCEVRTASVRVANRSPAPSAPGAELTVDSLDSAAEILTALPIAVPPLPPGGSVEIEFQFRTSFDGIPVECGGSVPFRIRLATATSAVEGSISFPTTAGPDGCGGAASLTCGPSQVRPIRPHG